MKRYRILWTDAAGEGRFTTVEAEGPAEAAWKAAQMAQMADSQAATFEEIHDVSVA